jgi:hypothetical protein
MKTILSAIAVFQFFVISLTVNAQTRFELNSQTICTDSVDIICPEKSPQEILSAIKAVAASMSDVHLIDDISKGWCKMYWHSDCLINMQKLVDVVCFKSSYEVMFAITPGHFTMRVVKIKYLDLGSQWQYIKGGRQFDMYSQFLENNGRLKNAWQNLVNVPNEMNSISESIQKLLLER